jgi:uncharacterized protein (DUF427 family)
VSIDLRQAREQWRWRGGETEIARTSHAIRVLETAHPPSFYLPRRDVALNLFHEAPGSSLCEWKGPARYWTLIDKGRRLPGAAWSYPNPLPGAEALADCVAFYASRLECWVAGARVLPQPGEFYGGWITPELTGLFKGEPGSASW